MTFAFWFGDRPGAPDSFSGDSPARRDRKSRARDTLESSDDLDAPARALVAQIRAGDTHAFDTLYLTYFDRLWRLAYRYLHSTDAAADVVQEIFTGVWTRRATWQPHRSLDAYLFRAVRNRIISMDRRTSVTNALPGVAADDVPALGAAVIPADEAVAQDEVLTRIRQAIDGLTERQRAATLLRWEQGLSQVDIAVVLGVSEAAVRKLLANARERLRPLLDELRDK